MQSLKGRKGRSRKGASRKRAPQPGVFARLIDWLTGGFIPRLREQSWSERIDEIRAHVAAGTLPMKPALIAVFVFYGLIGLYGSVLGGHTNNIKYHLASAGRALNDIPGFTLRHIDVVGSAAAHEGEIMGALGAEPGDPIFWLDTHAARARLEELPWVKQATVLRLLPDRVKITIEERKPFAVWQHGGKLAVVDAAGKVITEDLNEAHAALPLVVGFGANRHAEAFLAELDKYPTLRSRMRAAIRVADRRWNLRLMNGVDIRLPEDKPQAALEEIAALDEAYGLLARDIVLVDFRVSDRITIRLSDEAALRRASLLKEQAKERGARKKGQDT
mgnify:CR=1 FL=1